MLDAPVDAVCSAADVFASCVAVPPAAVVVVLVRSNAVLAANISAGPPELGAAAAAPGHNAASLPVKDMAAWYTDGVPSAGAGVVMPGGGCERGGGAVGR